MLQDIMRNDSRRKQYSEEQIINAIDNINTIGYFMRNNAYYNERIEVLEEGSLVVNQDLRRRFDEGIIFLNRDGNKMNNRDLEIWEATYLNRRMNMINNL